MARISLRAYNHEIENLIDRGQIEEAIAHCKNIIKQFPKHIETYRFLGKAFLESQRYAEAADILQRVLSVFPDDFVSQLGMSIIREDEGNLDASIWHMERAYEVQPFNRAVQDELRRLYGRRDGVEPPRIRLTRGALVRMYARGDLYPQAIAEIRAALAEDQKRVDLLVLLSRMYFLSGQKIEATEICSSLITKLPYCYEANRILKEVLPETSRAEDARIFQQRLFALDPYAAFISPNSPTSAQVPEQTVMVEKVEWQPSMGDSQSPDWARTIGVRWEDLPEEQLPDWLNTMPPGEAVHDASTDQSAAELEEPATPAGDEMLPEFMKDAGWQPSDGSVEEASANIFGDSAAPTQEELEEAEIPDWLKSLAPETITQEEQTEPEDKASLEWLSGILPAAQSVEEAVSEDQPADHDRETIDEGPQDQSMMGLGLVDNTPSTDLEPGSLETEEMPAWLQDMAMPATVDEAGQEVEPLAELDETAAEDAIPNWMQSLPTDVAGETATLEETPAEASEVEPEAALPEWIQQIQEEEEIEQEAEAAPVDSIPDWLKELAQDDETVTAPESSTYAVEEQLPPAVEESVEVAEASQPGQPNAEAPDEMDIDSAMAWMEALAAKQGADEESLKITSPEQRSEVTPDWIQKQTDPSEADEAISEEPASGSF